MDEQYGIPHLRPYISGRPHFQAIPPATPPDLFSPPPTQHHHHYELVGVGHHHQAAADIVPNYHHHQESFLPDSSPAVAAAAANADADGGGGGDGGTGRWPRQETLTLLEIRSRLDSKFKEVNHKGPLWDEVSRIMCEENGYQRSGKKCREKFENLYKYYKKTKEGKAGRQDGKNYRFFRQLEALYGDANSQLQPVSASDSAYLLGNNGFPFHHNASGGGGGGGSSSFQAPNSLSHSLSNYSESETSSSDDTNGEMEKKKMKRKKRRSWKAKIVDFIDAQMRKIMEKQEEWLEKMTKTIERKEEERLAREEEWRKQERERVEREHKFWASERAWIEARDAALMDGLLKLTGKEGKASSSEVLNQNENGSETITNTWRGGGDSWPECEISKLIQLKNSLELRFQQCEGSDEVLWEEIAAQMGCLGYERSGLMCREMWDRINNDLRKINKKRKEGSRSFCYFQSNQSMYNQGGGPYCENNEQGPEMARMIMASDGACSPLASNVGSAVHESYYRFLVAGNEGDHLWDSYGLKLSKGENQI